MKAYVIRRLLLLIPTWVLLTILVFLSVRFIPGDVIDAMVGRMQYMAGDIDREALEKMLGLDQPVHVQYGRWVGGMLFEGTMGDSLVYLPSSLHSSSRCLWAFFRRCARIRQWTMRGAPSRSSDWPRRTSGWRP